MAGYTIASANHRYVDYDTGIDTTASGYGGKMSLPWRTIRYAITNTPAGGALWIRRGNAETETASVTLTGPDSGSTSPTVVSSWPRSGYTLSGVGFTKNSEDITSTGVFSEYGFVCRTFTLDGSKYMFARYNSPSGYVIDPPFAGTTGSFDIDIDPDPLYYISTGLGSSEGADTPTTWDADSSDIYRLGFSGAYELFFNGVTCMDRYNIAVTGTVGSSYLVREYYSRGAGWYNSYFKNVADDSYLLVIYCSKHFLKNCVFWGLPSYNASQNAIYAWGPTKLQDCACNSVGGNFLLAYGGGQITFDNVRAPLKGGHCYRGVDTMFNGDTENLAINTDFGKCANTDYYNVGVQVDRWNIVNYNRAGTNRVLLAGTGWLDEDALTFSPLKTIKISWDRASTRTGFRAVEGVDSYWQHGKMVFEQKFYLDPDDGPWYVGYNVYNGFTTSGTSDECWLECSESGSAIAFDAGRGGTIYKSSGGVPSSGWAYVGVSGVTGGYITARLFYSRYSATLSYWVDPIPQIIRG